MKQQNRDSFFCKPQIHYSLGNTTDVSKKKVNVIVAIGFFWRGAKAGQKKNKEKKPKT